MGLDLFVVPDFISADEESDILRRIAPIKTNEGVYGCGIRRFGEVYPYRTFLESSTIPLHYQRIIDRIVECGYMPKPTQVSEMEFDPGDCMPPHKDQGGDVLCSLCLSCACIYTFTQIAKAPVYIAVPRCGLVRVGGEWKSSWKHASTPIEHKRYSIVFRTAK